MSWTLKGSYVETCSCELMCPCNLSFDHGATYDFCRATLAFHLREGDVDGTDIGGLNVACHHRHAEGHDRRQLAARASSSTSRPTDEQADKLVQIFSGQLGGPMAGLAPLVGEMLGVERAKIEVHDDGLRHSVRIGDAIDFEIRGHRALRRRDRRAGALLRHVPPGGVRSHDGGGQALPDQRLRHRYEGKTGLSTSEFSWAA